MSSPDSVEKSQDDSINFRRCWALGEAYHYLENNYNKCFNCGSIEVPESKVIRGYKSNILSIKSICNELGIKDDRMDAFLNELQDKLNVISKENTVFELIDKDYGSAEHYFEVELEGYIIGNLIGKDPRYNHIFRTAKHSLELYQLNHYDEKKMGYIKKDLESIKNYVSDDRITLIHEVLNNWLIVRQNYEEYNIFDLNKENKQSESHHEEYKPSYLKEIVNRIEGLIIGSLGVYDILNRRDRTVLSFVSYSPLLIPAILVFYISWNLIFNPFCYDHFVSQIKIESINSYLVVLTALIGALLAFVKSLRPIWQKVTDWAALKLAIRRLKDPGKYLIISPWQIVEKEKIQKVINFQAKS